MKKNNLNKKKNWFQKVFDIRYFFYDFVKFTGALSAIIFFRIKRLYKTGKKPKGLYRGSYIIASNHVTFLDPIMLSIVFWKRRVSFIATTDLFSSKLRTFFFKSVRMIPIDKQNVKMETFKRVKDVINSGHLILIFPEGHVKTKEETDNLAEYKSGVVMMSLITKTPLLPVYIKKRDKWYKSQKIIIGEKINIEDYVTSLVPTMEDIARVTKVLQEEEEKLASLLEEKENKKC